MLSPVLGVFCTGRNPDDGVVSDISDTGVPKSSIPPSTGEPNRQQPHALGGESLERVLRRASQYEDLILDLEQIHDTFLTRGHQPVPGGDAGRWSRGEEAGGDAGLRVRRGGGGRWGRRWAVEAWIGGGGGDAGLWRRG